MTVPRERLRLTEHKTPYELPVYLDNENNYWISVHVYNPETGDGTRMFLRAVLFNFDQIELPGATLQPYDGEDVNLGIGYDNVRFESEVIGEGL